MQFLNGREASILAAQLTNERVYASVDTTMPQLTQTNIWNQAVKTDQIEDPVFHLTIAIAHRQLSSAVLSSQILLAAIPYLYTLAADGAPIVLHVAADCGHSSTYADFTQIMSVRQSGLALISASSVQETYDLSLIAQSVSLRCSTPFLHFFDSNRISDECTCIHVLNHQDLLKLLPEAEVNDNFKNKPVPEPATKPSAYLQHKSSLVQGENKESSSLLDVHAAFNQVAGEFAELTGRCYAPLEYVGHPKAEYVIIAMGAGATVIEQSLRVIADTDPSFKVGVLKIRLYRPWSNENLLNALPCSVQGIAVLEPTDDYTCTCNPLFLDVAAAYQTASIENVEIFSGQYGVEDTNFTPNMVQSVLKALMRNNLDRRFKVSSLPTVSTNLQVVSSSTTEQIIFVSSPSLATQFASHHTLLGKAAQAYTINSSDVTHIRIAQSQEGPFLPSLIQSADAVVLAHLPLNQDQEKATINAIHALTNSGSLIIDGEASDLPASIKNAAHSRQAILVTVQDVPASFTSSCLSDVLGDPETSFMAVPHEWANEQQPLAFQSDQRGSSMYLEPTLPVETSYIKMLHQVFGSRLDIANAYQASSIWSPDVSRPHAATPEFGYGRVVNHIQERSRLVDFVMKVIHSSTLPLEATRVLSQWLLLVKSHQPCASKVQEASDVVVRALSSIASEFPEAQSILDKKKLLSTQSNWIIGSDAWAYDLGQSGLHHVITSGDNINILIVDTAPYYTTGLAKNEQQKKDIGLYAMNYSSVYVASVAVYASYTGVLQALIEADAYEGPSVVLAYLPQLYNVPNPLATLKETKASVDTGAWPLYRWNPVSEGAFGQEIFTLDSQRIKKSLEAFLAKENYLTQLVSSYPTISSALVSSLESDAKKRHAELKAKARTDYARLLSGLGGSSSGAPLTVLFGSDNGNAESVAKKIASRAKSRGLQVKLMAMDDYEDIQELANETNVVVICSSAGQGEMPSNARKFWKALNGLVIGDVNFSELNVSVFGLGDSHYWPREDDAIFYNRPGKLLDAKFENLGATRLVALGLGDDQDEDGFETALDVWQPELWKALGVRDFGADKDEPAYTDNQMKADSNYLRGNIASELVDNSTGGVTEITQKLIKFHGAYVQDDRDLREERKEQGLEKAFSFLIRVRTPGGVATSAQWLAMDALATKYGNNTLKLTTRQAFQLHGVLKKNLRTTIRGINKALLSTLAACGDVNRNIMSTAVTEIPEVHAQVQDMVIQLRDLLAPKTSAYHEIWLDNSMVAGHAVQDFEPLYGPSYLPRKFKVAIAVPPNNDVDVYAHDLGLVAIVDPQTKQVLGYNVLIGGGMGQTHGNKKTYPRPASPIGYIPADAVLKVAEAVVTTQRDHGDRLNRKHARFKYTVDDMGTMAVKKEIEARSGVIFEPERPYIFNDNYDRYGWTKGVANTWNFGMFIENGRVKDTPDVLCKTGLRELAKFHKGEFRLTANQHLVISNVSEADLEKTKAHLAKYKLDNLSFTGIRKAAMACVALPTCGLAMAESERYLPELITILEKTMEEAGLSDDSIVVRMTGCPNGCARPYLAELAFVGKAPGTYNMYLGGNNKGERLNKIYRENLQEQDILHEVNPMIKRYALERDEGEPFGDWVIRAGYVKKTITGLDFHATD